MHPTNTPQHGAEIAARMTPKARSERARKAAMKRHYGRLIPVMIEYIQRGATADLLIEYPSLDDLEIPAYEWVVREARRAMGY